ncbi:MAG: hypothetical protein P1U68_15495 [Verrucomicrobiales bacterium]|nr:hypothetical protein [Verrucomicrobiales bacterium]
MSFTLRNLFSEEDGEPGTEWGGVEAEPGSREDLSASAPVEKVAGQAYLVSELLPFIPPAIAASRGIPMEKEIHIPFAVEGSTDVKLSVVCQLCPELFDAEITPLNDSLITLPAKLGAAQPVSKAPSSIFDSPGTPFGAPGFSAPGSSVVSTSAKTPVETKAETEASPAKPGDNPFWSPEPNDAVPAKIEKKAEPSPDKVMPSGFSDALPVEAKQKDEGSSFSDAPAQKSESPPALPAPMSGFSSPAPSPGKNPFGDAPSPKAESKEASFSENPFESTEGFATLFSKQAEDDADIPFPGGGDDESTWGAMFDSENEGENEEGPVSGLGEMMKQQDVSSRQDEERVVEAPPEPSPASPMPPFQGFSGAPAAESVDSAPVVPVSESASTPAPVKPATPEPVPAELEEKDDGEENTPFSSLRAPVENRALEDEDLQVEVEDLRPTVPNAASALPGEVDVSLKDLEFRAIFSSDDSFTLAKVARKVVALEGVNACALATPSKLVQASRNEQSRLGDEAREMVDAIRNLAQLTGLPEARSFTLKTDRGTVSLFLEGDCCVTINHQNSNFGPGVREKLTVIAQSIHKLEE